MFTTMFAISAASCDRPSHAAEDLPAPAEDLAPPATTQAAEPRTVVLAGGCFWCTEAVFEQLDGVSEVVSGYAGGTEETADYEKVSAGATDHAEAIRITYDPSKVTYGQLLRVFFALHDPTTKDRQGPDWGRQYRSAVFYANGDEKRVAEAYIKQLDEVKVFSSPIVTTLEPLSEFFTAEEYHQDYVQHHPDHPYVRQWRSRRSRKSAKNSATKSNQSRSRSSSPSQNKFPRARISIAKFRNKCGQAAGYSGCPGGMESRHVVVR